MLERRANDGLSTHKASLCLTVTICLTATTRAPLWSFQTEDPHMGILVEFAKLDHLERSELSGKFFLFFFTEEAYVAHHGGIGANVIQIDRIKIGL